MLISVNILGTIDTMYIVSMVLHKLAFIGIASRALLGASYSSGAKL